MANRRSRRTATAEDWPWRGDSNNSLASLSRSLRSLEPQLGRGFKEGDPRGRQDDELLTVRSYLLGKLGERGFGRMLQRANQTAASKPKRRRRRRARKAVAA